MFIFTDGACTGNGKKTAKASWVVYIHNKLIIRGMVQPYEYFLSDDTLMVNEKHVNPTNNRGELLAIIFALSYINKYGKGENSIIYSDSLITVNTINVWYNNRKKNNTLHEFKNLDLINIIMSLYDESIVKCHHVMAHRKFNESFDEDETVIWNGNNIADKYATHLLLTDKFIEYEEIPI